MVLDSRLTSLMKPSWKTEYTPSPAGVKRRPVNSTVTKVNIKGTHTFWNPLKGRSFGGKSAIEDVFHGKVLIPGYNAFHILVVESGE